MNREKKRKGKIKIVTSIHGSLHRMDGWKVRIFRKPEPPFLLCIVKTRLHDKPYNQSNAANSHDFERSKCQYH
jgi:hypothetical protein